eukprot:COSAG05_NODE_186_length_14726_cov_28.333630_8_plen_170_part_00
MTHSCTLRQVQAQGGLRVSGFPEQHVHAPVLGYGLQLASFNGLYSLLPPASADAFPVWQKQPVAQEEDQGEDQQQEGESSGDATEEAPNKEQQQQRFLYLNEAEQLWRFHSENTPHKEVCWAVEKRGAAAGLRPLPMGAGMGWRVFTGEEVEDMSLTILGARHTLQNVW